MSGIESHGLQGSTENSWNDLHGCFRGFPARAISDCKMRQGIRARFRDRADAGRAERGRRRGLSDADVFCPQAYGPRVLAADGFFRFRL